MGWDIGTLLIYIRGNSALIPQYLLPSVLVTFFNKRCAEHGFAPIQALSLLSLACTSSLSLDLPSRIICRPPNDRPLRMWKFKIIKNALVAFLSACHTTVGDDKSPDESIHLAAAMQFSGFRSVIGSMWSTDDEVARQVVSAFYDKLVDDSGRLDCTRAAVALHKAVKKSRRNKMPLEQQIQDDDDVEWELQNNGLLILSNTLVECFRSNFRHSANLRCLSTPPRLGLAHSRFPFSIPTIFPLPEILLSSAFFSLAHLLRVPLFSLASLLLPPESACLASTFIHVLTTNALRLAALVILNVRHTMDYPIPTCQDPAFRTVWWLSLNFAEVLAPIVQGYEQLALYRDVMVPEGRETEFLERLKSDSLIEPDPALENPRPEHEILQGELEDEEAQSVESRIDRGLDELLVIKMRDELEEVYGVPVIVRTLHISNQHPNHPTQKIPVFISCLQRFNSIVLSVGLTLLLSAAYLRSPLSDQGQLFNIRNYDSSYISFVVTAPLVLLLHATLAALHSPALLPRVGVHTAAYVGVLLGIMSFFAGLAVWGALS
ncbi:hypothetical protein EV702DRAFT_1199147 [Suillus placidus]|uniref:CHAT domain-containing protein n=1 Tax=Suillus placidus TaxID=48579 RepID=A0A9P6ZRX3_9AGAM|nr:hypothetical protein EV702DRAFT_1199147 [Suillus placidus]